SSTLPPRAMESAWRAASRISSRSKDRPIWELSTPWRISEAISRNRSKAEGMERSRIQWPSQNPSTTLRPEIGSQRSKDAGAGRAADRVERIAHSILPGDPLDLFVDRSFRRADHGVGAQAGQLLLGLRTADNVDGLEPVMTAQLDDHLPQRGTGRRLE